jgi:type I restriction enzyme M protein
MKIETVKDYITDKEVKANPEEIDAVQPLCKELVEIYGYPKENIKSHPQHRVATSPSDENKTYPVDIAVFEKGKVKIICECKAKTKKQGKKQLMTYLNLEDDVKYGV